MGWTENLRTAFRPAEPRRGLADDGHVLDVPSAYNLRELGGYETSLGRTRYGRFVRSGGTRTITGADKRWLMEDYHVRRVLDLRGTGESPALTDCFAHTAGVTWLNVSFLDYDMSAPQMLPAQDTRNYLVGGYLRMLSNASAVARAFAFLAATRADECLLLHCAAGMDRTGLPPMLIRGLCGAARETIIADYAYSFATPLEVDELLRRWESDRPESLPRGLDGRVEAISIVYDTLVEHHGTVRAYLRSCGVGEADIHAVRAHLLG